ncbi:MAG: substrate-binding periplasmic protein, partial [Sphingomonadaceae bacterium]
MKKPFPLNSVARRNALLLLCALPFHAPGRNHRAPLRLTLVNMMPWGGYDARGRAIGALIELTTQLSLQSGVPIAPMLVPYGRAPLMLRSGASDLTFAVDSSMDGPPPLDFLCTVDIVIAGRDDFRFQRLSDLYGKVVGVLRHTAYSADLHAEPRIAKHPFDSYEQGLRMLRAGRLDAVMGVGDTIEFAIRQWPATMAGFSTRHVLTQAKVALYAGAGVEPQICGGVEAARQKQRPPPTRGPRFEPDRLGPGTQQAGFAYTPA